MMVMVMVMMLTLMTYAKLETYRSTQILDKYFNHYMEFEERGNINKKAIDQYKLTKMSSKASTPKAGASKTTPATPKSRPRLSLDKLMDKKFAKENPEKWEQLVHLLHNLTDQLYGAHPFYQEALAHNPNAIEDLAKQVTKAVDKLDKEKRPKTTKDLANLELESPELNEFFYKMLLGAPYKDVLAEPKLTDGEADTDEDDSTLEQEAEEYSSPLGYYSLLDFITLGKSDKIRVYLAPRDLLMAIYHDPAVVDELIKARQDLYKLALGKDDNKFNDLTESLKQQFEHRRDGTINSDQLDYTVNKTNPKEYEKSPSS